MHSIPTITVYTRHAQGCPRKGEGEFYKNCRCLKYLRWCYGGKQLKKSAKTRTWSIADTRRRELEGRFQVADPSSPSPPSGKDEPITIARGIELFLLDKKAQGISGHVLAKYERELTRFCKFIEAEGHIFPREITLEDLTQYRASWTAVYPSSMTRAKVQERLKSFLRYCYDSRFMDRMPRMSAIKVEEPPTMPLSEIQYQRLLRVIPEEFPKDTTKQRRIHGLIQLMRFSGLAIQDAVTLFRDELLWDKKKKFYRVETSRQKTGTHVSVAIPHDVAEELCRVMELNKSKLYIFWNSGTGKAQSAVTNWQHDLRQVFRAAGMAEGHPHQLRDTFAVWLLQKGVPIGEVSKALGHESIKTTEKYYAKWVPERQDRLDTLIMGAWEQPHPQAVAVA